MIRGAVVIALGFEPRTVCLEGRCSIQLSYATFSCCRSHLDLDRSDWKSECASPAEPCLASGRYATFSCCRSHSDLDRSDWKSECANPAEPCLASGRYATFSCCRSHLDLDRSDWKSECANPAESKYLFERCKNKKKLRRDWDSNPGNTFALTD